MLIFQCPSCKTKLQVADEHAGRTIACPKCHAKAAVPIAGEPAVEAAIVEPDLVRPPRSRSRRRARDDDDDDDDDFRDEPEIAYPSMIGLAAVAWILFGCLILLSGGANVAVQLTKAGVNNAGGAAAGGAAAGGFCGIAIVLLFGFAFVYVGSQTLRGTATDTLGNGIGSLVFGLLNVGCGSTFLISGAAVGGPVSIVAWIGAIVNFLAGAGLLAAGLMVLIGRESYLAWRRDQRRRR